MTALVNFQMGVTEIGRQRGNKQGNKQTGVTPPHVLWVGRVTFFVKRFLNIRMLPTSSIYQLKLCALVIGPMGGSLMFGSYSPCPSSTV